MVKQMPIEDVTNQGQSKNTCTHQVPKPATVMAAGPKLETFKWSCVSSGVFCCRVFTAKQNQNRQEQDRLAIRQAVPHHHHAEKAHQMGPCAAYPVQLLSACLVSKQLRLVSAHHQPTKQAHLGRLRLCAGSNLH